MAAINGICVKNMKFFYGHEGEHLAQGNLYIGNKKIGFWSQDTHEGPDQYRLVEPYSEKLLNEAVIALNPDKAITFSGNSPDETHVIDYDLDMLLYDYLKLYADEKSFLNGLKKGYAGTLVVTDGYHETTWSLPKSYASMSDQQLLKALGPDIEEARSGFVKETETKKHEIKIYRTFDDFIIGDPIHVQDIIPKKSLNNTISAAQESAKKVRDPAKKEISPVPER